MSWSSWINGGTALERAECRLSSIFANGSSRSDMLKSLDTGSGWQHPWKWPSAYPDGRHLMSTLVGWPPDPERMSAHPPRQRLSHGHLRPSAVPATSVMAASAVPASAVPASAVAASAVPATSITSRDHLAVPATSVMPRSRRSPPSYRSPRSRPSSKGSPRRAGLPASPLVC